MFSSSFLGFRKSIAIALMIAVLGFTIPKQSDAILLAIIAPAAAGAAAALVITELVIYCATGVICGGGGGGTASPDDSCTAENYCGMTGSGTIESDGFCNASPPPDSECTSAPFPEDPLVLDPPVVNIGDEETIIWDVGPENFPANCTLSGPQIGSMSLPSQTGSTTITVQGPHVYTLECGDTRAQIQLRLLGAIYET